MPSHSSAIAVYGATGHTGRFVVEELIRRGLPVIAVARDPSRVAGDIPARKAEIDNPVGLHHAFADCAVVINCAGPFLDTAVPVAEAALRAGCSYLDVTAEQASAQSIFETFDQPARDAGVAVIPAAAFYGGLADLLAGALLGNEPADEITVAIALDHWWPTEGTRRTGERNHAPRMVVEDSKLVPMRQPPEATEWTFDMPHGIQSIIQLPFTETITLFRHRDVRRVRSFINTTSLSEIRDATTPPPVAADDRGRSAQQFAMDVVAVGPLGARCAKARGRDIYAVSAPIIAEAASRLLEMPDTHHGALTLGQAFDAMDFLRAITPEHFTVEFERG